MGMEIPMDLINQIQNSLRREAKLSSYDPGGASSSAFAGLPSAADAIAELDASPLYLRCRNCKGKLLRRIESLICVFCGKQQRTIDNPPDPIKFTSTSGYRWLLSSLNLDGSEMVEPPKETNRSGRGQNAPIKGTSVSKLLDLEIQWCAADEKLANSGLSDGKSVQSKFPLNLGGVDLGNFFVEGRGAVSEVRPVESKLVEDDFKDPRSLSLFGNVESHRASASHQHENVSLSEGKDARESISSKEHENLSLFVGSEGQESISSIEQGNLSLFEGKSSQESVSSKGPENLSLFEGNNVQEIISFKEDENLSLFEGVPSSNAAVMSVGDKLVDSSSDWGIDFQSAARQNFSQEQKPVDLFVGSSVDLATHMDTVFGSGKDLFNGKSKDASSASVSNAGDWFQDDLLGNVIHEAQKNDTAVHDKNEEQMTHKNGASSMNIDWIQDDLWQTSGKKDSDTALTEEDEDWNDFASSTNSGTPNNSLSQTGMSLQGETFDGMGHVKDGGRTESGNGFPTSVDWIQDEKQNTDTSMMPDKAKDEEDDLFGNWNDFTSSTASQVPVQHSTNHVKTSIEQTSQMNLFDAAKNEQSFDFGGFSQSDFLSGGSSCPNNSAEVKILQSETSTSISERTAGPVIKDQTPADSTSNDLFSATSKSKADIAEELMSQMHDLSFMLESTLSVPPNSKTQES